MGLENFGIDSTKRKVFISYHHADQYYKDKFEELFGSIFINKSVKDGDINTDVSTDYIKRLIQSSDYLRDASVCVVLVGEETRKRKHVDWEISGALNKKLSGYSGLIAIRLPSKSDYEKETYDEETTPIRLVDNVKSGYASYYDWTDNIDSIKHRIELAFNDRISLAEKVTNSREQFSYNKA